MRNRRRNIDKTSDSGDEKPTKIEHNQTPYHRILSRFVTVLAVVSIVYFSSKNEKELSFAKQNEVLRIRAQNIECSENFKNELKDFGHCIPEKCARFVSDELITTSEVDSLLNIAKKGLLLGGSNGGASILDLHSGALSKGTKFVNIYTLDKTGDIFSKEDITTYKVVKTKIQHAISHNFGVDFDKLYLTSPTFFSEITPKEAVTVHDEYWHPHIDKLLKSSKSIEYTPRDVNTITPMRRPMATDDEIQMKRICHRFHHRHLNFTVHMNSKETYKSFHYTSLLYLNNYGKDFQGGRFIFVDKDHINRTIEPRKARVSMFTSGAENTHYVEKVTKGIRYALTISFTCDKKYDIGNLIAINTD